MKKVGFISMAVVILALTLASCGSRGHGKCPAYNGAVDHVDMENVYAQK